ncbi:MAG: AraC family transcriptional regulator ligand-binding domain-containing protein, partial [Alcanivorax sp.]|nr:AraC family transcriptional regulator ligand-binding domain-containing protein [Alcanivorax sp.]
MSSVDHSVTPLYAQALLQSAQRQGITLPADLIARLQGNERIPLAVQDELWECYCELAADPLAGLRLGLDIQVGHLDSAGMLLVTCETLGEALAEQVEYAPLIGAGGEFQLLRDGDEMAIDYLPQLKVRQAERVEAVLAGQLNLTRWATGGRFTPSGIWLAHAPLAPLEDYRALIDCP